MNTNYTISNNNLNAPISPRDTIRDMTRNIVDTYPKGAPRTLSFGKDSLGIPFVPGDLISSKNAIYEVETVFLDDTQGKPIESIANIIFDPKTRRIFNYQWQLDRINDEYENILTEVDPLWIPPYVGLLESIPNGWDKRFMSPLLNEGFLKLSFQSVRVRALTIDSSKPTRKSCAQNNTLVFGASLTKDQLIEYREAKRLPLIGSPIVHSKVKRADVM